LKTAEEPVQQRILENVSETKLEMVKEDLSLLPPMEVTDVEAAQARILKRLEELYPDESDSNVRKPFKSRLA
jgi:flagellar motor switch protein FliG